MSSIRRLMTRLSSSCLSTGAVALTRGCTPRPQKAGGYRAGESYLLSEVEGGLIVP